MYKEEQWMGGGSAALSDKCTLIVKGVIPGVTANASLKLGPVMARVTDAK